MQLKNNLVHIELRFKTRILDSLSRSKIRINKLRKPIWKIKGQNWFSQVEMNWRNTLTVLFFLNLNQITSFCSTLNIISKRNLANISPIDIDLIATWYFETWQLPMNTNSMRNKRLIHSIFQPLEQAKEHRTLISICIFAGSMFILSDIHLENKNIILYEFNHCNNTKALNQLTSNSPRCL